MSFNSNTGFFYTASDVKQNNYDSFRQRVVMETEAEQIRKQLADREQAASAAYQ